MLPIPDPLRKFHFAGMIGCRKIEPNLPHPLYRRCLPAVLFGLTKPPAVG